MIFDSHAHYNDPRFDGVRDELLASLPGTGICGVIIPGSDLPDQPRIHELAAKYSYIHAGAGIHPHYAAGLDGLNELEGYLINAEKHKIVAVGECGLDYFNHPGYPPPDRAAQRRLFDAQVSLAEQYKLPVIIHNRDAFDDCLDILRASPGLRCVFHCFSGDAETVKTISGMGFYISFAGNVTYKKNTALRQAAAAVPDEYLLVETDAPYLAPEPRRGKRCDSAMLPYTIKVLAEARGQTVEEIERLTRENALRLFMGEKRPSFD
jgi:TatD DNase family protein